MSEKTYEQDFIDEVIDFYNDGHSKAKVCKDYGISRQTLNDFLQQRYGYYSLEHLDHLTPEQVEAAKAHEESRKARYEEFQKALFYLQIEMTKARLKAMNERLAAEGEETQAQDSNEAQELEVADSSVEVANADAQVVAPEQEGQESAEVVAQEESNPSDDIPEVIKSLFEKFDRPRPHAMRIQFERMIAQKPKAEPKKRIHYTRKKK